MHPINQVEDLIGIEIIHVRQAGSKYSFCGEAVEYFCTDPVQVTCIECLKAWKLELEDDIRGNPLSPTYAYQYQQVTLKLVEMLGESCLVNKY